VQPISTTRRINAPIERVFQTVADARNFTTAVPHIKNIEFLTEQQTGVGTRFRETRMMGSKEAQTELEVTEYAANDHVRMVSDSGGTIWDTVFRVNEIDGAVELSMQMDIRPHKLLAKLFIPLIRGTVVSGVEADLDCVKDYCEMAPCDSEQ